MRLDLPSGRPRHPDGGARTLFPLSVKFCGRGELGAARFTFARSGNAFAKSAVVFTRGPGGSPQAAGRGATLEYGRKCLAVEGRAMGKVSVGG